MKNRALLSIAFDAIDEDASGTLSVTEISKYVGYMHVHTHVYTQVDCGEVICTMPPWISPTCSVVKRHLGTARYHHADGTNTRFSTLLY